MGALQSDNWEIKSNHYGSFQLLENDTILYLKSDEAKKSYQWLGWKKEKFRERKLRISGWLKFSQKPTRKTPNFGMKVCDSLENDFLTSCEESKWCYFTVVKMCKSPPNDNDHVLLIFDNMLQAMSIHIFQLKMEILSCGKYVNVFLETAAYRYSIK